MSTETITNICDSCKEHNYEGDFHISGFGESYTHKQFFEIVKTLRSILPGNRVTVTSNGDLLSSDKIKTTYESGVDYMIISCYDGETARDKFVDMFTQAGIADNDYEIRELWLLPGETVDQMMDRNQFNNRSGAVVVEEYRHEFVENACYLPFYKLVIDWDGTVLLCCNDWYRRHKGFGNINEISIKDIWLGSEFQKVRKNFHSGKRTGSACSNCNVNGTLVGHESVDVLMDQ
jgi:radical SAM protein with 4Fe4S-binding SPASM domain